MLRGYFLKVHFPSYKNKLLPSVPVNPIVVVIVAMVIASLDIFLVRFTLVLTVVQFCHDTTLTWKGVAANT
jgi:hypothetical protein